MLIFFGLKFNLAHISRIGDFCVKFELIFLRILFRLIFRGSYF